MADYAKMYQILFQAVTHACRMIEIDDVEGAVTVLKQAQLLTETIYIESSEGFDYDPDKYAINRIIFDMSNADEYDDLF